MTKRRRFTADFKAKVALEALRGDRTIQEIASRHKVHPNQVSTWKRQAMDGLGAVFANGAGEAGSEHEAEVHDPHAKIGQFGPPSMNWSTPIVRKLRIRDGDQATQTGRDSEQVAAGSRP
jgi:hypothetical protein